MLKPRTKVRPQKRRLAPPASGLWHLAAWRATRGWTQEQLAEKLNTTKGTVSKLEKGDLDMSGEWIKRYALALDIEPAELLRAPFASVNAPRPSAAIPVEEVRAALESLARMRGMSDIGAAKTAELFLEELQDRRSPVLAHRVDELRVAFDRIIRRVPSES